MPHPRVPDWIREFVPPSGWTNVFALVPTNEHLYATETLFGDWNGQTLLLAKDAAPTGVIRALRDKGDPRPWRHAQRELGDPAGWRTNETLAALASALPCRKLYGSATANLLFDDPRWSRSLPGFGSGPLHAYLQRVLAWVVGSMPNLDTIACLGEDAWFLTNTTLGKFDVASQFARHRDECIASIGDYAGKKIVAFALYHPAARVSNSAKERGWSALIESVSWR